VISPGPSRPRNLPLCSRAQLSSFRSSLGSEVSNVRAKLASGTRSHQRSCQIRHYFIGENSVGCMYVTSTFSTVFSLCSDFTTSWNCGSARIASQFFFASSLLE